MNMAETQQNVNKDRDRYLFASGIVYLPINNIRENIFPPWYCLASIASAFFIATFFVTIWFQVDAVCRSHYVSLVYLFLHSYVIY